MADAPPVDREMLARPDVRATLVESLREADRNVPIKAVQKMASQLRVESFEIMPCVGHLGWLMHEERVLGTLLDRE